MKDWGYFNRYQPTNYKYLPATGQGTTIATQTVTAVTKLVYKWYNDGDVYDNVHSEMEGWLNDLSSYANWLWYMFPEAHGILGRIKDCRDDGDYEDLLADLAELLLDMDKLDRLNEKPACESIYDCEGPFEFRMSDDDDEDEWYEDDYDDYDDEED